MRKFNIPKVKMQYFTCQTHLKTSQVCQTNLETSLSMPNTFKNIPMYAKQIYKFTL